MTNIDLFVQNLSATTARWVARFIRTGPATDGVFASDPITKNILTGRIDCTQATNLNFISGGEVECDWSTGDVSISGASCT